MEQCNEEQEKPLHLFKPLNFLYMFIFHGLCYVLDNIYFVPLLCSYLVLLDYVLHSL